MQTFDANNSIPNARGKVLLVDFATHPNPSQKPFLDVDLELRTILATIDLQRGDQSWIRKKLCSYSRGVLILGTALRQQGAVVNYVNPAFSSKELIRKSLRGANIVAVSTTTPFASHAFRLISDTRTINPMATIVLGGPHATALHRQVLQEQPAIDLVVRGDGEETIVDIWKGVILGKIHNVTFRSCNYRIQSGCINHIQPEAMIPPSYSLLPRNLSHYRINLQTTRGCVNKCAFCAGGSVPEREIPEHVIHDEWKQLKKLKKGTLIHICDTNMLSSPEHAIKVCFLLRKYFGNQMSYSCDMRGDSRLTPKIIRTLEQTGFKKICIGFETAQELVLLKVRKALSFKDSLRTAEMIKRHSSMLVYAYWIFGLPGMTVKSIIADMEIAAKLIENKYVDEISPSIMLIPMPGSKLFDDPKEYGMKILTHDWECYFRSQSDPVYELRTVTKNNLTALYRLFIQRLIKAYRRRFSDVIGNNSKGLSSECP